MISIWIFILLLKESIARDTSVSYPWNSTWIDPKKPWELKYMEQNPYNSILGHGLTTKALRLLKQGLKISYLPPTRYNCKFSNFEHDFSFI